MKLTEVEIKILNLAKDLGYEFVDVASVSGISYAYLFQKDKQDFIGWVVEKQDISTELAELLTDSNRAKNLSINELLQKGESKSGQ